MNELYFACPKCKFYVDAGYRWCYLELQRPGIVRLGETVDVQRVLTHEPYWNPPPGESSTWLYNEVFPSVREFFTRHREHGIRFWEGNDLPDDVFLNWLQLGYCPSPSPRYVAEVLGLTSWDEVLDWKARQDDFSLWAEGDEAGRERFRRAFEQYTERRHS